MYISTRFRDMKGDVKYSCWVVYGLQIAPFDRAHASSY